MQVFKQLIVATVLLLLGTFSAQQVRAELVATDENGRLTSLDPLDNGISTLTLIWPIVPPTKERVAELKAGLLSVISGGTTSRSSHQIAEYMSSKGIIQAVGTSGRNLLLTVAAPDPVFAETLIHLENLLLEFEFSIGWYARELQKVSLRNSIETRRPSDFLSEVAEYLQYEAGDTAVDQSEGKIRFGRPAHAVLRSKDKEVERRTIRLLRKLPGAKTTWKFPFGNWAKSLAGAFGQSFKLPTGTIHYADPDSSEMLILLVKAEEFEDAGNQIGANLLVDYIGATQGSEMFRIIRQEMRAAYDPRSNFNTIDKNKVIISLSASVAAAEWHEVYNVMQDIYENVRDGNVEQPSLRTLMDRLDRRYYGQFFNDPVWGVQQYLHEYPAGSNGEIRIPLFDALGTVYPLQVGANPEEYLPPFEEFLLILIGGGAAPTEALRSKGYCALPKNKPISHCLDLLSKAQN